MYEFKHLGTTDSNHGACMDLFESDNKNVENVLGVRNQKGTGVFTERSHHKVIVVSLGLRYIIRFLFLDLLKRTYQLEDDEQQVGFPTEFYRSSLHLDNDKSESVNPV